MKSKNKYFLCEGSSRGYAECANGCLWKRVNGKYYRKDLTINIQYGWSREKKNAMCEGVKEITEEEFILYHY